MPCLYGQKKTIRDGLFFIGSEIFEHFVGKLCVERFIQQIRMSQEILKNLHRLGEIIAVGNSFIHGDVQVNSVFEYNLIILIERHSVFFADDHEHGGCAPIGQMVIAAGESD